jgi:hypothetical protein
MKAKVFISKPNAGWSEIDLPDDYQHFSYEKQVKQIHHFLKHYRYKGLLITENPSPFQTE